MAIPATSSPPAESTAFRVLIALSLSHLLNDAIQGMVPAIYPLLKTNFALTFTQVGLITVAFQGTASILQPLIGNFTDRRPLPYSLSVGMGITLVGLVLLSQASQYGIVLLSTALVGFGSAVFHPEASRLARLASGGQHGLAQSLFQVGGNLGTSLGPLLTAIIVMRHGQGHILWFGLIALAAIVVLLRVGGWYQRQLERRRRQAETASSPGNPRAASAVRHPSLSRGRVARAMLVLLALVFSKYIYLSSLTSYYTFYLIERFHIAPRNAQLLLFVFLFAVAAGTIIGGPVGDRVGRKIVIWVSILGVAPFSLILPHMGLALTVVLSVIIGLVLASAFSAMLVFAQELLPGKVGLVSGLFFGFAFGMGALGSAVLGYVADHTSIQFVFNVCAFMPLIGLLAGFLPDLRRKA